MTMPASPLGERIALLRRQAAACRRQTILLHAKLSVLECQRSELRGVREQLVASSARLDHAVDDIASMCDIDETVNDTVGETVGERATACERRPRASLRP